MIDPVCHHLSLPPPLPRSLSSSSLCVRPPFSSSHGLHPTETGRRRQGPEGETTTVRTYTGYIPRYLDTCIYTEYTHPYARLMQATRGLSFQLSGFIRLGKVRPGKARHGKVGNLASYLVTQCTWLGRHSTVQHGRYSMARPGPGETVVCNSV